MPNQRSFVRDSLSVFSTRILLFLVGIVGGIIIARILGPTNKGILAIVVLVPTLFVSIGHLGIGNANLYFIGKKKFTPQSILSNSLILSIALGCLLIVLSLIIVLFSKNTIFRGVNLLLITLAVVSIPFLLLIKYTDYIFLGKQMIHERNLLNIVKGIFCFIGIVLFVLVFRLGVKGALISTLIGLIFGSLYGFFHLKQMGRLNPHFDFALFKESVSYGIKPYLALIVLSLNYRLDIFLVRYFLTNTDVGYYTVAVGIAEKLWFFPSALGLVTYSMVASLNASEANELTPKVCRNALLISFLAVIVFLPLVKFLIPLLYGKAYVLSINPFMILLPGVLAMTIYKVLHSDLAGRGRPEITVYIFSGTLVLNIILNILWIPRIGIAGAALASTVSYSAGAFTLAYIFSKITKVNLNNILMINREDLGEMILEIKGKMKELINRK